MPAPLMETHRMEPFPTERILREEEEEDHIGLSLLTCLCATTCMCWCTRASSSLPAMMQNKQHESLMQHCHLTKNNSPSPLLWSISRSFLMLSSLAWRVCFCVSILVSSSCKKKRERDQMTWLAR